MCEGACWGWALVRGWRSVPASPSCPKPMPTLYPAAVLDRGLATSDCRGMLLCGPKHCVTIFHPKPGRELLLAAMQQRGIELPNYDVVRARGVPEHDVEVEVFWEEVFAAGGMRSVGQGGGGAGLQGMRCLGVLLADTV